MEENKIYCKVENEIITGYFVCFSKQPYSAKACNFDEETDFKNAFVLDIEYKDKIYVNHSKIINGEFVENKPDIVRPMRRRMV